MALPFRYNVLSLCSRPTSTISSILLIGVVIAAFAYLQAVTDSAFSTMAGTGDDRTVIVLNQGAESETVSGLRNNQIDKLQLAPGAVGDATGPVISAELVAISSASTDATSDVAVNTAVRGVNFEAANLTRHDRVRLVEGRVFEPGTEEVIVGEAASRLYLDHRIGDEIEMGTRGLRTFKVVGIFSTDGTAADSEIWGYVETLRDVYGRNGYSSARMLATGPQETRELCAYIEGPAVELTATTEKEYFSNLSTNQTATQVLGVAMIVIMGIAAAFAVANTMFAAVAGRTREIGMLRAIGFEGTSILSAFVLEGMLIAFLGGVIGSVLSFVCHGVQRNMLPTTFTTVSYSLEITPKIIGTSLAVAVAIGFVGSIMPAWRTAKLGVTSALREA